jgi:hypothetical protein
MKVRVKVKVKGKDKVREKDKWKKVVGLLKLNIFHYKISN